MRNVVKRKVLVFLAMSFIATLAMAHEFWLEPKAFRFKVGEEIKVDFMVGENFTGEFWDLARHKVEKLEMNMGIEKKSLVKDVKPTKGKNLTYKFDREGTHLLSLESNEAFIELDGEKFNAYLKEDGLDNILDARTNAKELGKPSREFYKRFAKLIVQAGAKTDATFKKRVNTRLEIIPLANPYTLKSGDYLECKVMWEGKPAAHSLVKVWSHTGNRIFLQNIYAEDDGTVKFPLSSKGPWMVSSVKMIPSEKDGADYQSFWASLVFGIDN
jgi:uncharacterized GH25 family protein